MELDLRARDQEQAEGQAEALVVDAWAEHVLGRDQAAIVSVRLAEPW